MVRAMPSIRVGLRGAKVPVPRDQVEELAYNF